MGGISVGRRGGGRIYWMLGDEGAKKICYEVKPLVLLGRQLNDGLVVVGLRLGEAVLSRWG